MTRPTPAASDPDGMQRMASRRWQAEGRPVRIATPNREGSDFNDVLSAREAVDAR